MKECLRARAKHPEWTTDPVHASAIVNEEAGELTQAALDYYTGHSPDRSHMIVEAVRTGAMSLRFLLHVGEYLRKKKV